MEGVPENVNGPGKMLTLAGKDVNENVNALPAHMAPRAPWRMTHVGIGPGKKELGFGNVIIMLQTRYDYISASEVAYPQKGVWIYERDAQMRRHYKRQYPEFFSPRSDRQAAKKREEQHIKAERIKRERIARGAVLTGKPAPIDISAYRNRASS